MWRDLEPRIEDVRTRLARMWNADPECIAITRNASESLQIAQFGIDLRPGDEVLTTSQDYPRMITTWQQRERREKIVLKQLDFAVPVKQSRGFGAHCSNRPSRRARASSMCRTWCS